MISTAMTVAQVLAAHPELSEVLGRLHPRLGALLGRSLPARLTVTEAAGVAGMSPEELVGVLRRAIGEEESGPPDAAPACGPTYRAATRAQPRPAHLDGVSAAQRVDLDVRADIRAGREPFARIMAAAQGLSHDQVLVLRAPFEPVPLFAILARKGLDHWSDCHAPGDWSVWFYRRPTAAGPSPDDGAPQPECDRGDQALRVDVRGLEPPLPMARVLELLAALRPGQRLEVLHERRPVFLYPQIEERGFTHETDEPEPGMVRIVIRRPPEG
jgi:uncharacterized protein (DUF2249 family)